MDIPWAEAASFSAAALSAVAAVGAWMAAKRSNITADSVAKIESDRWHAELLPKFDVRIERIEGDRATLDVQLVGPLPHTHAEVAGYRGTRRVDDFRSIGMPRGIPLIDHGAIG